MPGPPRELPAAGPAPWRQRRPAGLSGLYGLSGDSRASRTERRPGKLRLTGAPVWASHRAMSRRRALRNFPLVRAARWARILYRNMDRSRTFGLAAEMAFWLF